jgi:hypothetical protein
MDEERVDDGEKEGMMGRREEMMLRSLIDD